MWSWHGRSPVRGGGSAQRPAEDLLDAPVRAESLPAAHLEGLITLAGADEVVDPMKMGAMPFAHRRMARSWRR
jgi:hypothetical protein